MTLKLVTVGPPDPAEPVKRQSRPPGILQCNRCGGRTAVTVVNGAIVRNGRKQGGTIILKDVCDDCRSHQIISQMLPVLQAVP